MTSLIQSDQALLFSAMSFSGYDVFSHQINHRPPVNCLTPYKINDTLQVTVKKAWIERQWAHSRDPYQTIRVDGYQLCIKSVEADLQGINFKWTMGVNGDKYIRRSGKSALISDFVELPQETLLFTKFKRGATYRTKR
ncbi:hypothetical protein [Arcticibacter tournemirensis]